jgi:hypothetical protein
MDPMQALRHIRTLINVASQTDDVDALHKLLREMRGVVNNALPPVRRPRTKATAAKDRELRQTIVTELRLVK